jgi:hypothetical protein
MKDIGSATSLPPAALGSALTAELLALMVLAFEPPGPPAQSSLLQALLH